MKKARQLQLPLPNQHGGKRKGAGRPNRSGKRAHVRRPVLSSRAPAHVTIKLRGGLPSMRGKYAFRILKHAVKRARLKGLRIIHFAILSNHMHLIVEPDGASIAPQLQSLCVSFAKRFNRILGSRGAVFDDRYHLHPLRTPRETRHALAYVLTNESHHRGGGIRLRIDPFSSARAFDEWRQLLGKRKIEWDWGPWNEQEIYDWLKEALHEARTWLMRAGWLRSVPHA